MASSNNSTHTEAAEMEQIITEFFPKSLQIILESRSPFMSSRNYSGEQMVSLSPSSSSSSSPSVRPRDKWFNLALRECPAALENLDLWHQSYLEPMIVDVILVQVPPVRWDPVNYPPQREPVRNFSTKDQYPFHWNSDQEELGCEGKIEKIVERWEVQYEGRKSRDSGTGSRKLSNTFQTCYMKSILLFRSLYATVRLLPAYKIFRDLNSSGKIRSYTLTHRVSSFVEPFTREEEAEMQRFVFTPVDTSCGRLCLSVLYHSSLSDVSSESSTPVSPQFIPDYVGSPLAEPVKRFPSLPVSQGSLLSLPFSRQHSWYYDHNKASPPSFSFSPSPNRSGKHGSISNPSSCRFQPSSLPPHPPEVPSVHKKNTSFDEHYPSPSYTPSPSPSPPIYIPESHLSTAVSQSESAPVSIPATKHASSPLLSNKQNLPPSPPLKATTSCNPKTDESTDDIRKYASVKTLSNSSQQISFSRTSSRPETFDKKGHLSDPLEPGGLFPIKKSQDAAVGALVHTLKKPPTLCQDFSGSAALPPDSRSKMWSCNLQEYNPISVAPAGQQAAVSGVASSGLIASKTAADALEELKRYEEMKDLLLSQAGRSNA
uniref:Autophagy-related protein 13 N-terminal domain-containing protein n=1 Tax=Populus trichocarpa TaxID=3694 RepID=A0A2K1WMN8_POPTR